MWGGTWDCLTCEAGGPGDVQVEVLGSVDEHVQVAVRLMEGEGRASSS